MRRRKPGRADAPTIPRRHIPEGRTTSRSSSTRPRTWSRSSRGIAAVERRRTRSRSSTRDRRGLSFPREAPVEEPCPCLGVRRSEGDAPGPDPHGRPGGLLQILAESQLPPFHLHEARGGRRLAGHVDRPSLTVDVRAYHLLRAPSPFVEEVL